MSNVLLSKLDVAKRELDHAIRLFFNNGDIVVIHLVISACQDVLEGINKDKKSMRMEIMGMIKKEKRAYVLSKLRHAYTFLKHADRDPKELLEFNPEASEYGIIDAIGMYQSLTGEITGLMMAFRAWFFLKNPSFLIQAEQKALLVQISSEIDINNKGLFLEAANVFETRRTGA